MGKIVINKFDEEYIKIDLFDSDDNFIDKLDRCQFLDVRRQVYLQDLKGYYVVYPNGKRGILDHTTGGVTYFPEGLWDTSVRLSREIMNLRVNDIKNQNRIVE